MANHDWEKFGEDIKKVVQDAIDSQDFDKLNQTITNTITNAADAIAKNMKNTGNKSGYRQEYGPDCSQAYSPRYQERKEQQVYDTRKSRPGLYRGTGYTRAGGLALAITGITMGVVFLIPLLVFFGWRRVCRRICGNVSHPFRRVFLIGDGQLCNGWMRSFYGWQSEKIPGVCKYSCRQRIL